MSETLLKVENLKKYFPVRTGILLRHTGDLKAVDDVSFEIRRGQTFGLVGETGCGKSTLGRTVIRLYEPTAGKIEFKGKSFSGLRGEALRKTRQHMQMIFQDPYASLDPRMNIRHVLQQPFLVHRNFSKSERMNEVERLIEEVGLKKSDLHKFPHEFSGGQRQRISIARAIALRPELIVADEAVSALDVSIQAQILNLLKDLQERMGLSYLFISHDLAVIEHMCDVIAVMYLGKIVEIAPRDELFRAPMHPYTQALLNAIPKIGQGKKKIVRSLSGDVPSPLNPPSGCTFHPRCPHKMDICTRQAPPGVLGQASHKVACWLHNQTSDLQPLPTE